MSQLNDHEMVMHVVVPVIFPLNKGGEQVPHFDSEALLQAQANGVIGCCRCDAGYDQAKTMPCIPVEADVDV